MRPVLTADEYRRVDKAFTGDLSVAMDRAGHGVALAAARAGAGYGKRVIVLAGPGNNGGDGYVAARYLKDRGAMVEVHAFAPPKTGLAQKAAALARVAGVTVTSLDTPVAADVVIDALFGGGMRSGIPETILAWMDTSAPVVAVDFPTGLDPDTGKVEDKAFQAVETVTFSTVKTGHLLGVGPEHCGNVTVADIGIHGGEPSMFIAEQEDAPRPQRGRKAHKWSAGSVLIIGGSTGIVGASVFAGRSALAFGAGAVVVVSPRANLVHQLAPELPTFDVDQAMQRLDRFDVVIAGPGLAEEDAETVRPLLKQARNIVLDAGGLTPVTLNAAREGDAAVVVTPHDGEFIRIAGAHAGTYSIRSFAAQEHITVLRKGNPTMISDGDHPILVTTGGPELASIGTGDVLAGMIGALWARGLGPVEATTSAAFWHGVAGADVARTRTLTAPALVEKIAEYAW